jgi:hypothetical protein
MRKHTGFEALKKGIGKGREGNREKRFPLRFDTAGKVCNILPAGVCSGQAIYVFVHGSE